MKPYKLRPDQETGARLSPSWTHPRRCHLLRLRNAYLSSIDRFLTDDNPNRVLIDFGCGAMPYRPLFGSKIKRYIGVDLPGNDLADYFVNDQMRIPLENESADIILSSQVLEHVPSPEDYLAECHRLLKPDGLLFLSTHGYWMFHPDPTDYWRWTSQGLTMLVNKSGFDVVEFNGVLGLAASGAQLLQDGIAPIVPNFIRPAFAMFFQTLIWLLDRFAKAASTSQDAGTYMLVARKICL